MSGRPPCRLGFDAIGFESNMEVIILFAHVFLLNIVYGHDPYHIVRPSISYIGVDGLAPVENAGNVKTKAGGGVPPSIIEALQKKLSQVISKITFPIVQSSNFI